MPRWSSLAVLALYTQACSPEPAAGVGAWRVVPSNPLLARSLTRHAWVGNELFVWGGDGPICPPVNFCGDGALLDPVVGSWRTVEAAGAPSARTATFTVWTGTEVF